MNIFIRVEVVVECTLRALRSPFVFQAMSRCRGNIMASQKGNRNTGGVEGEGGGQLLYNMKERGACTFWGLKKLFSWYLWACSIKRSTVGSFAVPLGLL